MPKDLIGFENFNELSATRKAVKINFDNSYLMYSGRKCFQYEDTPFPKNYVIIEINVTGQLVLAILDIPTKSVIIKHQIFMLHGIAYMPWQAF